MNRAALEAKYPTLFYDIVHVRTGYHDPEEQRTAKQTDPTLSDVITQVLTSNKVVPTGGLLSDLVTAVNEFMGEAEQQPQEAEAAAQPILATGTGGPPPPPPPPQ